MTAEAAAKPAKRKPTRRQRWTLAAAGGFGYGVPYLCVILLGYNPYRAGVRMEAFITAMAVAMAVWIAPYMAWFWWWSRRQQAKGMPLPLPGKWARLVTPVTIVLLGLLFWSLGGGIAAVLLVLCAGCLATGIEELEIRSRQQETDRS